MHELTTVICRKVGMTRLFRKDGTILASTVLDVATNFVVQPTRHARHKTVDVAFVSWASKARVGKPQLCYFIKQNCPPSSVVRTFSLRTCEPGVNAVARIVSIPRIFRPGKKVDVRGKSIGKGFAGVIKRHGFGSGKATHGNSKAHNKPGSVGMTQDPGRVFPGKRMAGHMGNANICTKGVEVVFLAEDKGLLAVKGAVPGPAGNLLSVNLSLLI